MSDRLTPETDAEWDRLQMLPGGGYSSRPAGIKLAFGMAGLAAQLERQRDEARELARELLIAIKDQHNFSRQFSNSSHNSRFAKMQRDTEALLAKAKEVLP